MNDSTMQFAIGCSGFHVSTARPFVGNISNVAIYDVALTKEQVEVLSLENEITTGIATEPYIASVDNVVKFDGNVTKNLLTSNMSLDEMLEELSSSWVDATLSDSSKMQLPITWTYVQKNGDVYKAFGYARATHLGVLSVTNFVPVEQVLEVHTFGTPTYSWSEDFSKCTATMVSDLDPNITITETVNSSKDVVESTTDTKGKITYKAEFSNVVFETQTHEEELDLLEPENQPDNNQGDENNKPNDNLGNEDNQSNNIIVPVIIGSVCLLGLIVGFLLFLRKRKK